MSIVNAYFELKKDDGETFHIGQCDAVHDIVCKMKKIEFVENSVDFSVKEFSNFVIECFDNANVADWIVAVIRKAMFADCEVAYTVQRFDRTEPESQEESNE